MPESDKELSGDLYTYVTSSLSSLWGAPHLNLSGVKKHSFQLMYVISCALHTYMEEGQKPLQQGARHAWRAVGGMPKTVIPSCDSHRKLTTCRGALAGVSDGCAACVQAATLSSSQTRTSGQTSASLGSQGTRATK